MKINIHLIDDPSLDTDVFFETDGNITFTILSNEYSKKINKKYIIESLEEEVGYIKRLIINKDEIGNYLDKLKKINDLLNELDNVEDVNELVDKIYVKSNSVVDDESLLKGKKIYLNEHINLFEEDLKNKCGKWLKYGDNLYIFIDNNSEFLPLSKIQDTIKAITDIANTIKSHNLSPFEEDIYAYDIVRSRIYKQEDKGDSYKSSRDLSNVLNGDKIVCLGYANLYDAILKSLGHKSKLFFLESNDKKTGHAEVIEDLKDNKYRINGYYLFDPTFDSKGSEDDMTYLDSYKHFAKSLNYMRNCYDGYKIIDKFYPYTGNTIYYINIINKLNYNYVCNLINKIRNARNCFKDETETPKDIVKEIQIYENFKLGKGKYNLSKEELKRYKESLKKLNDKMFPLEISSYKLFEAITKVRKLEYYDNPEMFPYSYKDIRKIFSDPFLYDIESDTQKNRDFYYDLNGDRDHNINPNYISDEEFNLLSKEFNLNREISRVKLTRTLKEISDKKERNI